MTIESIQTEKWTMDFCRFGQGKQPLVILPGLSVQRVMGAAEAIETAYRPLTEDFTLYVFERRNNLPPVYTVRDMARDTAEAIRSLRLESVCLFGASQGGMMAMEIALHDPELVRRLMIGSSAARMEPERMRQFETWIQLAEAGDAGKLYLAFGEAIYPEKVFEQSRDLLIEASKTVTDEDLSRFVILAEGMRGFDITDQIQKIACPVLVTGSADDRVLGPDAAAGIAAKPGGPADCELYLYDGFGHAAYDLAPDYKERMLRFFKPAG